VWGASEPATRFPHSSHEPVLPLGVGITLDRSLSDDHPIPDVVHLVGATAATASSPSSSYPNHRRVGSSFRPLLGSRPRLPKYLCPKVR
jgi:hypothetical protein